MRFFEERALRALTGKVGLSSDQFDFGHEIDRNLSFGENKRLISAKLGVKSAFEDDFEAYNAAGNRHLQDLFMEERHLGPYHARRKLPRKLFKRSEKADKRRNAGSFGRRVSKTGRVYYEWRVNHADSSVHSRL